VRTSGLSCEAENCRARRRLLGGGPSSRELVGDAPNWLGTRRLASDGLDRGSSVLLVLSIGLHIVNLGLHVVNGVRKPCLVRDYLVVNFDYVARYLLH
jgi:hypothetical protein